MINQILKFANKLWLFFGLIGLTVSPTILTAAPGTLSNSPIYLTSSVEPNIFFLSDDSGSMDWDLMTSESDGVMIIGGYPYYYALPAPENDYFWVVASEDYLLSIGVPAPAGGVWRARNKDYNKVYYNPLVTYKPWSGEDSANVAFTNSNPVAARVNPYYSTSSVVDLTANRSYSTDYPGRGFFTINNYYPARYYTWTDTNGNGLVDASDTHVLIEIKSSTASYTGGSERTDCTAAPTCSYAEEIQNFANWFSYNRKREYTAKNAITSVIADKVDTRIGYGTINDNNSVKKKIKSMNADPLSGHKDKLFEHIYQTNSWGGTPLRTSLRDVGRYFECTSNNFFGASGNNCPIFDAANGGMCQQNFTVLMTDGYYNGGSPGTGNTDGDDDTKFDGDSYADNYSDTLADVAMDYYERDLRTSLDDLVPTQLGIDEADHQHMVTYTVAFGVSGSLDPDDTKTPGVASDTDPEDAAFNWPNPTSGNNVKIDDLWHTAYNGRGKFLSAQNPEQLNTSLNNVLTNITGRTSSAAAVAFNSTTLSSDSIVYLARFDSMSWKGELLSYDLSPVDGSIAASENWNAATVLNAQTPASRLILTYNKDLGTPANSAGVAFKTLSDLSTAQQNDLNTGPGGADGLGQDRLDYIRGDRTHEGKGFNFRMRDVGTILGDIVHSNPVHVSKPQMNYPDNNPFGTTGNRYSTFVSANAARNGIIYVGANDGMLHGFDETSGSEVFAYIPSSLFSTSSNEGLHFLTDPAYAHRYYVDLSSTISDVFVKTVPTGTADWKTVLIGGLRGGGRGLFALDITDPTTYSEAAADNIVMWEFNHDDDNDLGYAYSKPTIALLNNNRWGAIVGNGYNDLGDGEAKLFILYLDGGLNGSWVLGTDYEVITSQTGTPTNRNGLSTPDVVDTDFNGTADRVYAGDLEGNLWAFDLSQSSASLWDVAYQSGGNPVPLFTAISPSVGNPKQPITTKPVSIKHPTQPTSGNEPNILVYFGTGQYVTTTDETTGDIQSMYGIWDKGVSNLQRSNLVQQTFETSSTPTERVPTDLTVDYNTKNGWFLDLNISGERVVVTPKIRSNLVFFNTLVPDVTICSYGGSGWLMALKQINGGRPSSAVFDINNDDIVDSSDLVSNKAPGGILFNEGIPAESSFLGNYQYTPGSTGELQKIKIKVDEGGKQGRHSWKQIEN